MNDLSEGDMEAIEAAQRSCMQMFALRGYARVDTPILEQTELFLRKSGGELSSRLFSFSEPGGYPVSLRPEFTAPVIRYAIESRAVDTLPLRLQYAGPVFRYAMPGDPDNVPSPQFMQLGAELIGTSSPQADGEIIAMALGGLRELGVPEPKIIIGHIGLIWALLRPFGLSDRARLFLVNSVGELRRGEHGAERVQARARELGLLPSVTPAGPVTVPDTEGDEALALVQSVLGETLGGPLDRYAGSRTSAEIVARLARKLTTVDDPEAFKKALGLLSEIAVVNGPTGEALSRGEGITREHGQDTGVFQALKEVVASAEDEGVATEAISVNFGLARGIAYYTGMVFDVVSGSGDGSSLGGGGRYDGLPRALGADVDIAALGFAYNMHAVLAAIPREDSPGKRRAVLVQPADSSAHHAAVKVAAEQRNDGIQAIVELDARPQEELLQFARQVGVTKVITVSANGETKSEAIQ